MTVVVLGAAGDVGAAVIAKLIEAGDEVGVVEPSATEAERWRRAGAHVARGHPTDSDLIERAAQNARTIVVLEAAEEIAGAAIEGARLAGVERIVATSGRDRSKVTGLLRSSELDYVWLHTGNRLWAAVSPAEVAMAVDSADDLPGHPRLELTLRTSEAWRLLRLDPPRRFSRRR